MSFILNLWTPQRGTVLANRWARPLVTIWFVCQDYRHKVVWYVPASIRIVQITIPRPQNVQGFLRSGGGILGFITWFTRQRYLNWTLGYIESNRTLGYIERTELKAMIRTREDQALTSHATKASSSIPCVRKFFVSLPCQCNSKQNIWEKNRYLMQLHR